MEKVKCWDFFNCNEKDCPVYVVKNLRCWLFSGTHCRNEIQGKYLEKMEMCLGCKIFKTNMDVSGMKDTTRVTNEQFKEFRKIVHDRDKELENIGLELALGLSEVFEALKKISSGDPTVRIPETSKVELISKLKHIVNITAAEIGEIVDQSHEFAMGLAEHFDVLHKVSTGNLHARVTGKSQVELLESFKKVTNDTIASISREINDRKLAEAALLKARDDLELRVEDRTAELKAANNKLLQEIVERERAEEALKKSEEQYRSLVESTHDSIYVVDREYRYVFINKKHLTRLGLSDDGYIGRLYYEFHTPEETKAFIEKADEVFNRGESVYHEYQSLRDGRYFLLTLSPAQRVDETIIAITVISKEITDYKKMQEQLRELSLTDQLTCVYNRRGLFTLVDPILKQANRQKKGILMLYADVDNLKEINDTFGHKEGDAALIETANILKTNYRESDITARIGGDEFVVIPVGTAGEDIEKIVDRLEKSLEIYNSKRKHDYRLSLSTGVTYYDPENPCSIEELLIQADELMYKHKKKKRNLNAK
jgi:diguanylate cyclase (GGDEF)-like protein/PAS domain S-box-containing protein